MSRPPVEIPMARAQAHLVALRYPQAIGAFRAAVGIDPTAVRARLGLARALAAHGRSDEAVDGLLEAAEAFSAREAHDDALGLIAGAQQLAPERLELQLDAAMVEEAAGRHEAALVRVEGLADRYMDRGRTEEAAELLRFVASWEGEGSQDAEPEREPAWGEAEPEVAEDEVELLEAEVVELEPRVESPVVPVASLLVAAVPVAATTVAPVPEPTLSIAAVLPLHAAVITGATVIARNPLLDAPPVPASPPSRTAASSDTVVCLRFDPEDELGEQETTVAAAPVAPPAASDEEPDADMVTRVADLRHLRPCAAETPTRRPVPVAGGSSPMVQRLRARAGFRGVASPRPVGIRATEPLSVREAMRRPSMRDEEVTIRYRRPRGLAAAAS
ncbi:MAG: hypothetical protein KC501_32810 [Myxococcales bacterium]|nr:hypothetical protein [Myxococcales bacterium]